MNVKEALEYGIKQLKENSIKEPNLKARLVLSCLLEKNKEYLMVHDKEELSKSIETKYFEGIKKLCDNIPLQYITNKQEFIGIEFYVDDNVLIPQPDTEILVEEVISICKKNINNELKILDLCTGSGAIGIALAKNLEKYNITLSDISLDALNVAEHNCKQIIDNQEINGSINQIQIIQSDLFQNIEEKFDIIVSNPPYIKTEIIETLDKEVQKEPKLALDGGKDGLDTYRRIINEAYKYLNPNGYLCLEIGYDQKEEVISIIKCSNQYENIYSKKDLAGNDRIIICNKEN